MQKFSDLLATDHFLEIVFATENGQISLRWPVMVHLDLCCKDPTQVTVDGIDVTDFGYDHEGFWRITLHEPFYHWRHRVTGQGWLLQPIGTAVTSTRNEI